MRYVIMANGKGRRWNNYQGIPKHLAMVDGETLLARTTRLILEADPSAEVVISSSNPACEAPGARRHEPVHYQREIDRFCVELIEDQVCFLYGDTFYTPEALRAIISTGGDVSAAGDASVQDGRAGGSADPSQVASSDALGEGTFFFGTEKSIVAIKSYCGAGLLDRLACLNRLIDQGELEDAKGWTLYHLYAGMDLPGKEIGKGFIFIDDSTTDFNTPQEYEQFKSAE